MSVYAHLGVSVTVESEDGTDDCESEDLLPDAFCTNEVRHWDQIKVGALGFCFSIWNSFIQSLFEISPVFEVVIFICLPLTYYHSFIISMYGEKHIDAMLRMCP